jgi:hypothetical protein
VILTFPSFAVSVSHFISLRLLGYPRYCTEHLPEKMATFLATLPNLEALSIRAFESESREGALNMSLEGLG